MLKFLQGGQRLGFADVAGSMKDLAIQVTGFHTIPVCNPEKTDSCGSQVICRNRAKSPNAGNQNPGLLQLDLTLRTDFRQDQLPIVPDRFFGRDTLNGHNMRFSTGSHAGALEPAEWLLSLACFVFFRPEAT